MILDTKQYVKIAEAGKGFAVVNKGKNKGAICLLVVGDGAGDSTGIPSYSKEINDNAIELDMGDATTRASLPVGDIYAAPLKEFVEISIQTWEE